MSLQSILSRFVRRNFLASCIHHKTRIGTVFHYSSVKALHQYVNGVSLESNISVLLCASVSIYHATKLITVSVSW